MSEAAWSTEDIGDLTGRTAVVTGPTRGGLGFHTALELARHGARVALAGRTPEKLEAAAEAIAADVPGARLETLVVDLSDLASVREGAAAAAALGPIHLLVNNAGIMATPLRHTADGLESQMATNHFGPFLLTGLLLDQLVASGDSSRRTTTPCSVNWPIVPRACGASPMSTSSWRRPASSDSRCAVWAATACTSHPGRSVGTDHWSSPTCSRTRVNESTASHHTATRAARRSASVMG